MKITHDGKRLYDFQYIARSALRANDWRSHAKRRFLKHGKQKKWYRNGQLAENLNYEYGIQCGKQQCWSIDGKLSEF
jgi:hypothetical protein